MISLEDDICQSTERAMIFGAFMNSLSAPTEAQLWLERAAAGLEQERDPDGAKRLRTASLKVVIMERDGGDCWFCGKPLRGDVTLEHLQPRALGGSWNEDNLALAHRGCNKAAGHLSRIKKEAMRDEMRAQSQPQESEQSDIGENDG